MNNPTRWVLRPRLLDKERILHVGALSYQMREILMFPTVTQEPEREQETPSNAPNEPLSHSVYHDTSPAGEEPEGRDGQERNDQGAITKQPTKIACECH